MTLPYPVVTSSTAPKTPPSPKVIASAVAAFVVPALLLGLLFLQTDEGQAYFGGLPKILVVIIGGLITSGITYLTGYVKRDALREAGATAVADGYVPTHALDADGDGVPDIAD